MADYISYADITPANWDKIEKHEQVQHRQPPAFNGQNIFLYKRLYDVPPADYAFLPTEGQKVVLKGVTYTTGTQAEALLWKEATRVYSVEVGARMQNVQNPVWITFYRLREYS